VIKPPYKIPSMAQINSVPWNGLKVIETFAGGGGSDTGWRWAGFNTVWANEFEKNPCATYRANHPNTFLDTRDIKIITAKEILMRCRLKVGELDVFSGSPPCQGFSIANQNRLQGKEKKYDNGIIQKNEDLFFEYIRLIKGLQPKVFVAENVKGLTIGKAKSILGSHEMDLFDNQDNTILHGLMNCGYVVRWQILNAADYGTPQSRQRVFFIGVRKDLNLEPCFPVKQGFQYSVLDALPHLAGNDVCWSDLNGQGTSPEINKDNPAPCDTRRGHKDSGHKTFVKITAGLAGDHRKRENGYDLENPIATIKRGGGTHGHQFFIGYGVGYKASEGNAFASDVKKHPNEPFDTIQKMPGVAGGSPVSVVDGETKRKFTIQELKRLGGFPDDYKLTGSYSKMWEVIGNSVCPPQMNALADCLYQNIFLKL
jgi:DNA (cytosine-5)-methyltransferase 1